MNGLGGKPTKDLSIALGCVIYDSLILAIAIQMWRTRKLRPKIPDLSWSEAQIAIEVILLKTRVLVDFLTARGNNPDDIRASDFGYKLSADFSPFPQTLRDAINRRSAHLSWMRVAQSLPDFGKVDERLDAYATSVMTEINSFIAATMAAGIMPSLDRHRAYLGALRKIYAQISSNRPRRLNPRDCLP
jgi:hypothetical protein